MSDFIGDKVWPTLTRAAKSSKASLAAVAYFGQNADRLLPLARGSILVVDASDQAVKSGQTHPATLSRLLKRGVNLFSCAGLHAKVYVFGNIAYIGSANASVNSQKHLIEAITATRSRSTVASARQFIRDNCHLSLGPEQLQRLQQIYRPPKSFAPKAQAPTTAKKMKILRLSSYNPPREMEATIKLGKKKAERKIKNLSTHQVYDFYESKSHKFYEGQLLLPVYTDNAGVTYVCPPGPVSSITVGPKTTKYPVVIFLETAKRNQMGLPTFTKRAGRRMAAVVKKNRVISDQSQINLLLDIFRPPLLR